MPVSVGAQLIELSQAEFAKVSYGIMAEVFALKRELGRLFNEQVYKEALKARLNTVQTEVEIEVSYKDFHKSYFMDVLASSGAVFELKAVDTLHHRHRSQLLNYLLLSELQHGKLVNVRPEQVEHEFVNAKQTHAERTLFDIKISGWHESDGFSSSEKSLLINIIKEWGVGLERALYEEALIHFLGGQESVNSSIEVIISGNAVATQPALLCAPASAFKITTFENNTDTYRNDLTQFLSRTSLKTIQWINISRNLVSFETIT